MSILDGESSYTPFQKFVRLLKYSFLSQIIFFATIPIIFKRFESSEYGIFAIAFSIASIVGTLSALRLERAIVIEDSEKIGFLLKRCFSYVLWSTLICILILYFALKPFDLSDHKLASLTLFGSCYCLVFGIQQVFIHLAIRQEKIMLTGISDIAYSISLVICLVLVNVELYDQAVVLISVFLFSRFVSNIPYVRLNTRSLARKNPNLAIPFAELLKYHIPVLTVLVASLQSKGLLYLTGLNFGSSVSGDLSMSQRITYAPVNLFGATLRKSFFLEFTAHGRNKEHIEQYVYKILNYGSLLSILILPLFVFLVSIAEPYIPEGWDLFTKLTVALYPAASILVLLSWLDRIYDARKKQKIALFYEVTFTVVLYSVLIIAILQQVSAVPLILIFTSMTVIYNLIWSGLTLKMIKLQVKNVYLPALIHLSMLVFCFQYLM